jgi:hypothetical protein
MKMLLALGLILPAAAAAASPAKTPLLVHQEPRGIGNLVVPGDRVQIVYSVDSPNVKNPTGVLYVRNDSMRSFARLPLRRLSAYVPERLLHGRTLTYYAVIRDSKSGRSVSTPRRSAWILEHPSRVRLGTHRFGKTRAPEAAVAHWPAANVGWQDGGDPYGPETFLVGADGSILLDDELNQRVLVSQPGGGSRTIPLPDGTGDGDVALSRDGTLFVTAGEGVGRAYHRVLYRVSPTGAVRWKHDLDRSLGENGVYLMGSNSPIRFGPDGRLFCLVGMPGLPGGEWGWMPVATAAGRPIEPAAQRRGTLWPYQPVAGGKRLVSEVYTPKPDGAPRQARFALFHGTRLVRAWQVLSGTDINFDYFTPEVVGGDVLVSLDTTKQTPGGFRWEYTILRLGPRGLKARFSLPRAVYGDNLLADLRVGPDGDLYQLASSPDEGVTVNRFSLR